ncbi:chemotaxis protein CheW [Phenylobacterium sp.]|uniref:hybrid sensor histidine kinase/response regulator n=1 Tax=Phenylobacterium sp. TaxID=1871053 RepID=UPI0025EAF0D6|nr:chemotaxis protein CheW [Phenylobacterium sp.]
MDDLVSDFIAESREGLEALDSELVRFEQSPNDPETLGGIFRLVHTIKGTCGFLGLMRLQTVAHAAENVLGAFRDGDLAVTPDAVSTILEAVDLIRTLIDGLAATGAEPAGDDADLIARLEAVLTPAAPAAEPLAPEPDASVEAAPETPQRPLIERIGNDSTLDAAVEGAISVLTADERVAVHFGIDQRDAMHAALRDTLATHSRKPEAVGDFQAVFEKDPAAAEVVFDAIARALHELDVEGAAIDMLRQRALPAAAAAEPQASAPAAEPEPAALPEPAPVAVAEETPAAIDPEPEAAPVATPPAVAAPATPAQAGAAAVPAAAVAPDGGVPQTIRVTVDALEHLMTVVSELVLIRNQLIQTLRTQPESPFAAPLNRLNQVTSELQEGVMTTRMQPISGAWAKLPRLVRDLAHDLGKSIDLAMYGQETELDRQVLEMIRDPLTHMIRNAADHGLERPEERRAAGKSETGRITLQARHEGGAILIEVADDGRGLPAERIRAKAVSSGLITAAQAEQLSDSDARQLIFLPGFSTAAEVTSVSGRGVGMDVVRTNIEKIGGTIEVTSAEGEGTRFLIRIPLTLTIVSALIVECCGERFALPQSSVVELVSASGASGRAVEYVDGAAVLRLRDRLLPLVSLQQLLQLEPSDEPSAETCIVVAKVGGFTFGVIVDRVFDTEEIVVKPVATVLRHLKLYSGATILGDGSVILILDLKGVSVEAGASQASASQAAEIESADARREERTAMLVFRASDEALKATPLSLVSRIEELSPSQIEKVDGRTVIQYRGRLMPIVGTNAAPAETWDTDEARPLLVFARGERAVGLLAHEIVDIVESTVRTDLESVGQAASGSLIIEGAATELIDVDHYWRRALNEGDLAPAAAPAAPVAPRAEAAPAQKAPAGARRLLVIDGSAFAQLLLAPLLGQAGYEVKVASDPEAAMALYDAGETFQLIMADTSNPAEARAFAGAFARAEAWHRTPLLSLSLENGLQTKQRASLLDAVSEALGELKGAA